MHPVMWAITSRNDWISCDPEYRALKSMYFRRILAAEFMDIDVPALHTHQWEYNGSGRFGPYLRCKKCSLDLKVQKINKNSKTRCLYATDDSWCMIDGGVNRAGKFQRPIPTCSEHTMMKALG